MTHDQTAPEPAERAASPVAAALEPLTPAHDAWLLPAVYEFCLPFIAAGQHEGPLPPVRSEDWLTASDEQKLATLLVLAQAWLVADPHRVIRGVLKQASDDVHGGTRADCDRWRRLGLHHARSVELVAARQADRARTAVA